ncbi:MAG: GTPase domain-containing protein, partial [Desulfovibrio sp.]|nr:GTPase domain-containing protein [Desulfovibrio sp.]
MSRVDENKLIFVIVGPRHAGKTVYLASLANNASITSGDPATIKLLKLHWGALRAGKNPPATAGAYTELEFIYRGEGESGRFDAEFSVADYDGHFAEIMSDYDSGIKGLDELRAAFEIADGFIVFMPFDNDDIKTMEAARFEIGHFIRIVRLCRGGPEKIDTPLVVVINKWDKSPDFKSRAEDEAALKFANSTESYRSLLLTLENFFANVFVIPVSAYGHAAPGDVPVKGKIVPYRAEEPIQKLLAVNYRLFRQKLQKAEDENDWGQCLSVLKNAAKLWRGANGRKELEKRLALVSANYAKDLKSRLVKARNMEEWEGIFKSANGALLIDFLSPEEKREIANTRETPLRAAYASLDGKLRSASDLDEFKAIREESPESAWSRFFDMDQKRSIDDLEKNFARSRLKKRVFFWGKWGCVAFCALLLTVAVFWRSGVESRYLDALGDHGSLAERYHKLREFMAYGVNSPLTAKIFADKFADAEKKAANLVSRINESWEKEFAGIIAEEDPLVRLESATRFRAKLSEDDVPGQKSMDVKIAALIQNSGRQVDLIQKIE